MKTSKLDKAIDYLVNSHNAEYCTHYGEPGYQDPEHGIIFADWNDIPKGLADWLEKCGYSLEWSDEWYVDYCHSKAYRTRPDSYHWESSIMLLHDRCEYITPDDSADTWIEACQITSNGQPMACLPSWISEADILEAGFTLQNSDLESGFFPGQTDDPVKITADLIKRGAYRVLFQKRENSQFYCRFAVYADFGDDATPGICPHCNGSGEGQNEGSTCSYCKGKGEI